jgi:hypothetical protein
MLRLRDFRLEVRGRRVQVTQLRTLSAAVDKMIVSWTSTVGYSTAFGTMLRGHGRPRGAEGSMTAEEFVHFHSDGVRNLKLLRANLDRVVHPDPVSYLPDTHSVVKRECEGVIDEVIGLLPEKMEAKEALAQGLVALERVDDLRFLLDNLIEAVKRDASFQNSLQLFGQLGLAGATINFPEEKRNSPFASSGGAGRLLRGLWKWLKKVALTLMEIVTNAIKASPKWVSLKPKPSIGLAGAFPTFSLEFELEAESITLHDLFEQLTGPAA